MLRHNTTSQKVWEDFQQFNTLLKIIFYKKNVLLEFP